jgi:hypothetical protein
MVIADKCSIGIENMVPFKLLATVFFAIMAVPISVPSALALSMSVPVSGDAGPWDPIANSGFNYGMHDQAGPSVVGAGSGMGFVAGSYITIEYVGGAVAVGANYPLLDARGLTSFTFNNLVNGHGGAPSFYMDPLSYPIYSGQLVGAFADALGIIVGSPFAIGLGPISVAIPSGVSQLQFGVNDNLYADNLGSFTVQVTGLGLTAPLAAAVPEPASLFLFASGAAALMLWRWRLRLARFRNGDRFIFRR